MKVFTWKLGKVQKLPKIPHNAQPSIPWLMGQPTITSPHDSWANQSQLNSENLLKVMDQPISVQKNFLDRFQKPGS
jgi:hypothetical protein